MKILALLVILLLPVGLYAQDSKATDGSFEDFCRSEALSIMDISSSKLEGLTLEGEITLNTSNPTANYEDYNIELAEDRTLYYAISGSDQLLVVKSLYRLRLLFETQNNQAR